ncbi:CMRF35-like molecule 6 isoform X2 [Hippoglossus stenolepis]|uniref:CMRF35-like molecule 6 isoform X2 n=1 Tax=Hippoglossus stenolepis TaxID=195615 RepID=UPI00159C9352|nr:CMRF35-like molecule 6 isoform X2 [Hippoglossus stenolepis]
MKPALRSEKEKGQRRMSSMDKVFLILILVGGFWKTEAISVKGELGGDVTFQCSHSYAYGNVKYFCKASCKDEDVVIKSNENSTGKYSIKDEGNTFNVTISRLTEGDAGKYWCGIERVVKDTYKEVVLTVVKGKTQDPEEDFSQSTIGKLVYIGAGLGGVVLALAVVLLIFFKHRNKEISTTSGKHQNTEYASPSSQSGNGHSSRDQSDDLFYSTVNFNTHRPAEVTYSTITHIPTDESDLYCNL